MILTFAVAAVSFLIGCWVFADNARYHARRANSAERERDDARKERDEFWRDLLNQGELHFHDGPIIAIPATSSEDAIAQLIAPRRRAGSGPPDRRTPGA
jgi:hypothetical protein